MNIAIFQQDVLLGDVKKNRENVTKWIDKVGQDKQIDSVFLPELWSSGYAFQDLKRIADEAEETNAIFAEKAKQYKLHIFGGSIVTNRENKYYNTAHIFNKEGALVHKYDKTHLVPMLDEPAYFQQGEHAPYTFTLDNINFGLIVCYDLRFPELARMLTLQGAEVLVVPAAWPKARTSVWLHLLQARAIENQVYVVGINRVGGDDQTEYGGHSVIIDPRGDILSEAKGSEATITAQLKREDVYRIREEVPSLKNRRPELYE